MNVSIIIPFYNQVTTVPWTIQSALRQTYTNKEIVLVDDGSENDGGSHIARMECDLDWRNQGYEERTNGDTVLRGYKAKLLTKKVNGGTERAVNEGVAESSGELLLILSGDDWIDSTFLEKTVPLMAHRTGIVSTDMHVFSDDSDTVVKAKPASLEAIKQSNTIPFTSLIRRAAFSEAGGFKENTYHDWNLWIDLLKRGWQHAVVNEPLFHYRRHIGQSLSTKLADRHEEMMSNMRALHPEIYG